MNTFFDITYIYDIFIYYNIILIIFQLSNTEIFTII